MCARGIVPWVVAAVCVTALATVLVMGGRPGSPSVAYLPADNGSPTGARTSLDRRNISVSGQAERWVGPDRCRVFLGCQSRRATLAEARSENNGRVGNVLGAVNRLRIAGLKAKAPSLKVKLIYANRRQDTELAPVIGYEVSQDLTVLLSGNDPQALSEQAGKVVDAALGAGATSVGDIMFFKEDDKAIRRELLAEAVKSAMTDARVMTQAASTRLGSVWSLRNAAAYRYEPMNAMMQNAVMPEGSSSGATVVYGQVKVECRVDLEAKME